MLSPLLGAALLAAVAYAQPSPAVQKGITKAIQNAKNGGAVKDFTAFVNPFIGTDNFGDVCPGAR